VKDALSIVTAAAIASSSPILFSKLFIPLLMTARLTKIQLRAGRHALRIAGISDFHFHDLRHTFCSNFILSGAGPKEVEAMIGNSYISMTDSYSHLTFEHKRVQQVSLSENFSKN